MKIDQVRSWTYALPFGNAQHDTLRSLPSDMMVLGDPGITTAQIEALKSGGPQGSRLVLGYTNTAEFQTFLPQWKAEYDANNDGKPDVGAPDWLGNANAAYNGLYSAKYWTAGWRNIVYSTIDDVINKGYDGIFLDVLGGFTAFEEGNAFGNAVRATARADMAELIKDIYAYAKAKSPNFIIIGNNAHDLIGPYPDVRSNLDALVVEASFWVQNPNNGVEFGPGPTNYHQFVAQKVRDFIDLGKEVFSVDYIPQLFHGTNYVTVNDNRNQEYFEKMIEYDYIPSLTHPFQTPENAVKFPYYFFGREQGEIIVGTDAHQDFIWGDGGDDSLSGLSGDDIVFGGLGRDALTGGAGNDTIDGGAGLDTAIFQGTRASYTLSNITIATKAATVTDGTLSRDGIDTLSGVERIRFSDQIIALDTDGNAGQGYRIYQAAFARTPDLAGLSYWVNQLDTKISLRDLAFGFIASNEFKTVYGAAPTNLQLVTKFYQNVLGRDGEKAGIDYWVGLLDSGTSVIDVLAGFSEGKENIDKVAPLIGQGISLDASAFA